MNQADIHKTLLELQAKTAGKFRLDDVPEAGPFEMRLASNLPFIKKLFFSLYPEDEHRQVFDKLLMQLYELFIFRPADLKRSDLKRSKDPRWYQSEKMVGMQLYTDHFNSDLKGLISKLDYFEELGVNFLHLMPLMKRPKGENDGGYAVSHYTEVDRKFGSNDELKELTRNLRKKGMFLMLDFVVNHTSDEHEWAKKAKKGDKKYQDHYYMFPDRTLPNLFDRSMLEIFPETAPGNFTYEESIEQWVMTTFNSYQWDLNYRNPEVFLSMFKNLIDLGNMGVDIIRFDALAFLWKKLDTTSQNLPEAHSLIQLFRMCTQVVAPGMIYLAEAIVAPKEIVKYFGQGNECEIAYNATLMALLWESIATKETRLIRKSLSEVPLKSEFGTWINYARCHDDIGLGFEDEHIYGVGWDASEHRKFLIRYYCRELDWSPAKGLKFMYNPENEDARITGSMASLAGLETALEKKDKNGIAEAVAKINLLHSILLSYGGIPMIYSGDEIGTLNDYSFLEDPAKKDDSRWVNRPYLHWETVNQLKKGKDHSADIFFNLQRLIAVRKSLPVFADSNNCSLEDCPNPHIFAFMRWSPSEDNVLMLCNFDDNPQTIDGAWLQKIGFHIPAGYTDLAKDWKATLKDEVLILKAYEFLWLRKE
ncbi:alpha amylase [Leptobacterium flavescens]|uniref:Alpha amylase n=1 Tax=Leptobacterium flavescens TaxID=472055 RepID=A0A6P0UVE9_9FLAO|nr:alpha-amylase family protein [Leptobacterium flavescens]NER14376.1 alpha amylase [Leptobacterium flavescens]